MLFVFFFAFNADSATYYVSTTGNDATGCTNGQNPNTPFRWPRTAAACLAGSNYGKSGTIHIAAGVYSGDLATPWNQFMAGSDANNRVIIEGEGAPGCAMISSCKTILKPAYGAIDIEGAKYVTIRGLEVDASLSTFTGCLRLGNPGFDVVMEDLHLHHCHEDGIFIVDAYNNITIRRVHVHNAALNGRNNSPSHGFYIGASNVTIEYSRFHDNGIPGVNTNSAGGQCYSSGAMNGYLEGHRADNCIVRYSSFYNNQGDGLALDGQNVQVYGNLFYKNFRGVTVGYSSAPGDGGPTGSRIFNNTSYGNLGNGIQCGLFTNVPGSCNISNNLVVGNGGSIVYYNGWTNSGTASSNITTGAIIDYTVSATDFHLKSGTIAVDKGITPSIAMTDFAGVSRPQNGVFDIGAYEFVSENQPAKPAPPQNLRAQ
jgi:hypothetical protein